MNTSYTNEQYQEAAAFIAARITGNPETAIILGSGLGSLDTGCHCNSVCRDSSFYAFYSCRS